MCTHREHVDRCERGAASPKKPQKDNFENNEHLKPGLHLTLRDGMRASARAQTIKCGRLQLKELETLECFSAEDTLRGVFSFLSVLQKEAEATPLHLSNSLVTKDMPILIFPVLRCTPSMRLLKVAVGAVETADKPGQRLLPVVTSVF